jgi:hypothetical protein
MIDLSKEYQTRDGRKVYNLRRVPYATYYIISGSITPSKTKRYTFRWTADGKYDYYGTIPHDFDLVLFSVTS